MNAEVTRIYGEKVRVRACGILTNENGLLLINHGALAKGEFWSPPGGGIEFGETAAGCLKREFSEETGLKITVEKFLFICEFISPPLHAIELFFRVTQTGGRLKTGFDPEMKSGEQLIQQVKYMGWDQLRTAGKDTLHGIFKLAGDPSDILHLKGYLTI